MVAKNVWLWLSASSIRDQIILISALPSLCILVSIFRSFRNLGHQHYPVVGKGGSIVLPTWRARLHYITQGVEMIKNGYLKYTDTIFQVPTVNQNLLVLPTKYVDELKSLPETTMSSSQAVADYFLGSYTTMGIHLFGHVVWDVTRGHLTQNLGNHVEPLVEEAEYGFAQELPACEVTVHPTFLQIVGRTSARIFVGHSLCRNALWLQTSIDFARCVFLGSGILKVIPSVIRPVAALFSPHMHRIRRHHRNARRLLVPEILRRREQALITADWKAKKPNDMLQWLEDASEGADARPGRMVDRQLGMSFAAIHTTTNHLTNVIYDLAARWDEYGPALRAEVEEVLVETNQRWKKTTLTKLSKMDSFMKESQRLNPPSALSFNRKLQTSYTITSSSPPEKLPKNSYIAVAAGPISASGSIHESPATFDGFRFHRIRSGPGGSAQSHQFVSTGLENMTFGHGRFACPGRFFASNESKIILALLLLKYDIRFDDRGEKSAEGRRPKNLVFADACYPDPDVKVMFKRRVV
ncbi:MAG: hypothetical protein L6R37_006539 [Teloschistes peruensis]|nr:MAG: hypothetical protein L6R37_006539 [Teloschistes peruensis]